MVDPRLRCGLGVLAGMMACLGGQESTNEKSRKEPIPTIRAQDIPEKAQIVGRLGHPLGSLLTIRGKWTRPDRPPKPIDLKFHVDLVNGESLKEPLELDGMQLGTIWSPSLRGKATPGDRWDWKVDVHGDVPRPTGKEGETWEMMGVETGTFVGYSREAAQQFGGVPVQKPYFMHGFVTYFEFAAMRKIP